MPILFFGTTMNETMGDCIKVSVIATGFVKTEAEKKVKNSILPVYNDKPWQKEHNMDTGKKLTDKRPTFNIVPWINRTIGVN